MGILIKASCVICVIALYSPAHDTPVDTKATFAAATALRQNIGSLDTDSAVKGIAIVSQATQTLQSMPADVRGRFLEGAANLVMAPMPPAHAKRPQP